MLTIGRHLIAEFYSASPSALDDLEHVRKSMLEAARAVGATVLGQNFHRFDPQGVSGTVVIAESHLSIHTWPERGYAAIDIYTCGGLDPRPGFEHIGMAIGAEQYRVQEILRGLPEELENAPRIGPDDIQVITRTTPCRTLDTSAAAAGP